MDDSQLIEQILKNNNLAFRSLIEKYKKLVYNTIFRIVGNQHDAEDIFQEVFLQIFKSCQHVKNEEDLTMWIYKIAYNKSISFIRKKNPAKAENQQVPKSSDQSFGSNYIDNETPARKLEQQEAVSHLFRLIDELPESQKKVLLMHKFEGFSQKEICERLKLSATSVESLMYRAKKNLKNRLTDYFKH
ncbi:sigma-70 family RNA polymerase sigma factor [Maribellus comscasis]|uniref:Sigma-70 family RNA polymerase sigma factor n=1 Tax=Maribellus comscasis TaxID=2681766 RepID=A0A6I6K228_9BACT|nr:RNA polymerase sigma factor [Maribellus comscasis]QGY45553.1 sigma-70 family RNA polymerase sigma factor [Maribellus comscasis]